MGVRGAAGGGVESCLGPDGARGADEEGPDGAKGGGFGRGAAGALLGGPGGGPFRAVMRSSANLARS
jgi:hypothetical protein